MLAQVGTAAFAYQAASPFHPFLRATAAPYCCANAAPAATDPKCQLFSQLLSSVPSAAVQLKGTGSASGRTLVATKDVAAGDALLTIPKKLLVTAHRSGVIGGLEGQTDATWDVAGDLREEVGEEQFSKGSKWDVRLALAVFEACAGSGGLFWDQYRTLLPPPPRLAHPMTLPDNLLAEIQDDALAAKATEKKELLAKLYPLLADHAVHPATQAYAAMGAPMDQIPLPLPYAYALVVSRCFTMSDGDTFAFVPFLDMADHEARPAANFQSDTRGFVLKALRPVAAGEAVSICYGEDYTTRRLFEQYGFVPEDGTAADAQTLRELVEAASKDPDAGVAAAIADAPKTSLGESQIAIQALGAAFSEHANSTLSTSERRGAIFDALTGTDPDPSAAGEDATGDAVAEGVAGVPPGGLLAACRWELKRFPTSLEEDERTMEQLLEAAGGTSEKADPRIYAVLNYRLARKRLLSLTEQILSTFLGI